MTFVLSRKILYDGTKKKGSFNFHSKTIEKYRRIMYNICKMDFSAQKTPSGLTPDVEKNLISLGFRKKKGLYSFGKGDVVLCFEQNAFPSELFSLFVSRLVRNKIKTKIVVPDSADCEISGNVIVFLRVGNKSGVIRSLLPGETRYSFFRCGGKCDDGYAGRVFGLMPRGEFYSVSLEKEEIVHSFYDDTEPETFSHEITLASLKEDEKNGQFTMIRVPSHSNPFMSDAFLSDLMVKCGAEENRSDNRKPLKFVCKADKAVLVSVADHGFADILLKFTEALNG